MTLIFNLHSLSPRMIELISTTLNRRSFHNVCMAYRTLCQEHSHCKGQSHSHCYANGKYTRKSLPYGNPAEFDESFSIRMISNVIFRLWRDLTFHKRIVCSFNMPKHKTKVDLGTDAVIKKRTPLAFSYKQAGCI